MVPSHVFDYYSQQPTMQLLYNEGKCLQKGIVCMAFEKTGEPLFQELARCYVEALKNMEGRKPGPTSTLGASQLRPGEPGGYHIPFNPNATGCGAAMRSMCIGLRYPHPSDLSTLIQVSIESGRMTHHHQLVVVQL